MGDFTHLSIHPFSFSPIRPFNLQSGFLLTEALILVLIVSLVFIACMRVMSQTIEISSRSAGLTEAISNYEKHLFELESALRPDLAGFGGHGELEREYNYEIQNLENREIYSFLQTKFSWNQGRDFLDLSLVVPEGGIQ